MTGSQSLPDGKRSGNPRPPANEVDQGATFVQGTDDAGQMDKTFVAGPKAPAAKNPAPAGKPPAQKTQAGGSAPPAKSGDAAAKTQQIGDFKILKKLGQGGMGTVYLGHQVSLDRPCAIKVLSKEMAAKPGFVERFVREARSMAKINHPNVVGCYHVGDEKGLHFIAVELMDGRSMQDWLDDQQKLTIPDAVLVTLVCSEALAHAHGLNLIHRDIKPDNILVTKAGIIKVSDLGLAKAVDDEDMSMTQSGTGLGTPHYMPPEQARNAKHVDQRCDIYALGVTLYHFLTGQLPFAGDSVTQLILNKEKGQFSRVRKACPECPEKLDLIVDKMMAKNPDHRYKTFMEVIRDLEAGGWAGESLSFITSDKKAVVRRSAGPPTMASGPAGRANSASLNKAAAAMPSVGMTSMADAERARPAASLDGNFYVRTVGDNGKPKIGKMTVGQVLAAMRTDKLDPKSQASPTSNGPFLPLAQIPVFEGEASRMLTRMKTKVRGQSLASEYSKLEKQYNRRKWWEMLSRFKDGTLGFVGLLAYLAAIGVIIVTLYLYGWPFVKETFLNQMKPTSTAPAPAPKGTP